MTGDNLAINIYYERSPGVGCAGVAGPNLKDNRWHNVVITRNGRHLSIVVDGLYKREWYTLQTNDFASRKEGGGGGEYLHILTIRVCATVQGMVFKPSSLEQDV